MTADQDTRTLWMRLFAPWYKMEAEGDDDEMWRKSCGFLIAFLSQTETGFEFSLHGGDDEVLKDMRLRASTIPEAMKEGDACIAEFVQIGAGVLATSEIRITHAYTSSIDHTYAVGVDGILYRFNGVSWTPIPMMKKST